MKLISVTVLRKELGLSFLKASTIINEQRAMASKRHRALGWTAAACAFASGASSIFDLHWPRVLTTSLWLAGIGLIFVYLHLIHRDSREPILATIRAAHIDRLTKLLTAKPGRRGASVSSDDTRNRR